VRACIGSADGWSAAAPPSLAAMAPLRSRISPSRVAQASATDSSTRSQLGMPARSSGGKYVPAKNGT
jgi:hypothetical protein